MKIISKISKLLIVNPFFLWAKFSCNALKIYIKNRTVKLGFLSEIKNSRLGKYVVIHQHVKIVNSSLNDFTYVGPNSIILHSNIGKYCCISHNVQIGTGKHPVKDFVSSHPIFYSLEKQSQKTFSDDQYFKEYSEIVVGNDVWIGTNVVVVDGVKIGDGAIIAAGSVVTKDVNSYEIVGGIPAKLIRKRFDDKQIEFLIKDMWWNKDLSWIKNNFKLFHNIETYMDNNIDS